MLNRTEQNLKARGDRDCICAHEAHVVKQSIPPSAHGVGRAPNYRFVALSMVPLVDATSKNHGARVALAGRRNLHRCPHRHQHQHHPPLRQTSLDMNISSDLSHGNELPQHLTAFIRAFTFVSEDPAHASHSPRHFLLPHLSKHKYTVSARKPSVVNMH